jgi:hypothetical protein
MKLNANITKATLLGLTSAAVLLSTSAATFASEVKYKYQLDIPLSDGSTTRAIRQDTGKVLRREWAFVKVQDNKTFFVQHSTEVPLLFRKRWNDHPVKAMKVCITDGFDLSDCKVVNSDTATIPEGRTIHDLVIEIRYSENGEDWRRRFNIPREAKSE